MKFGVKDKVQYIDSFTFMISIFERKRLNLCWKVDWYINLLKLRKSFVHAALIGPFPAIKTCHKNFSLASIFITIQILWSHFSKLCYFNDFFFKFWLLFAHMLWCSIALLLPSHFSCLFLTSKSYLNLNLQFCSFETQLMNRQQGVICHWIAHFLIHLTSHLSKCHQTLKGYIGRKFLVKRSSSYGWVKLRSGVKSLTLKLPKWKHSEGWRACVLFSCKNISLQNNNFNQDWRTCLSSSFTDVHIFSYFNSF